VVALAVPCGVLIGLVVATIGGGGAILAMPLLVYVLGESPGPATTASLLVVATAAAIGGGVLARRGRVCWKVAVGFAGPAVAGALIGTIANHAVSGRALLLAFVPVLVGAAIATWRGTAPSVPGDDGCGPCPVVDRRRLGIAGLGAGAMTGFFGVGGGFLIVPVLALWVRVPIRRAVATSLVIIAITGAIALGMHVVAGARMDVAVTLVMAAATAAGAIGGSRLGERLPRTALAPAFAVVVVALAGFLLVDVLVLGGPPGA
jgi:uncharacterized membrane protein YfcA